MIKCLSDGIKKNSEVRELAEAYAHGWSSGEGYAICEVEETFKLNDLGEHEIHAVCVSLRLQEIESIDRLITASDYRRNNALKEFEGYRKSFPIHACNVAENMIIDADYEETSQ